MASFQIHSDQENRAQIFNNVNKENVQQAFQPKRSVLGAIDNKIDNRMLKAKQPLGIHNKKTQNDENVARKVFQPKQQAPVIPVAQFQAFKVYEESEEKKTARFDNQRKEVDQYESLRIKEVFQNFYKGTAGEKLVTKKEALEQSGIFDQPKPQLIEVPLPMSIEKSAEKKSEEVPAQISRSKDFFFELEEYRENIYSYLREKELRHRAKPYYMRKQPDITHNMRTILIDWLVEVSEEYKLQTETLYLAINYIDRFLSYMSVVRAKLQLVGTAAMFIAAKYEEIYPPDVSEFVYITDDTYSKRQVIRMEVLILKVLDFDLSVPTAYTFITALSIANRLSDKTTFLAQYLSELALLEAEPTLEILPSIMAAAAIAVARHALDECAWSAEMETTTGYTLPELRTAVEHLSELHRKAETLPQQAIQEKYKQGKYLHVSKIEPAAKPIAFD